jgi:hypothetical protein
MSSTKPFPRRAQARAKAAARPKVQMRSYIPTNYLSPEQARELAKVVDTCSPDLHDPAAVEVLLVLLAVCHILDISDYRLRQIFGSRQLHALEARGDIVPPKQRPAELRRAWVWVSNRARPTLYPIGADGAIHLHASLTEDSEQKGKHP